MRAAVGILLGAMLMSSMTRAETPAEPAASPSPAVSPAAAATPAEVETITAPTPTRETFDDGLRDGRAAAHRGGLFAKEPSVDGGATPEYLRGYDEGFAKVAHHRHTNAAVVGGFALVLVGLAAAAYAQSQSGSGSGAVQPIGLRF